MAFKADYSRATTDSKLKPEGDYECIITGIEERSAKTGTRYLNFTLTIRNDVEGQRYGNACLFFSVYEKKTDPTKEDMSANGYNFDILMGVSKAAGLPKDAEYKDFNDFIAHLQNKCVLAHMEYDDYNDKVRELVRRLNPTKHPDCKHVFKAKTTTQTTQFAAAPVSAPASTDDDDYPFM